MTGRIAGVAAGLAGVVALVLVGTGAGPTIVGGLGLAVLSGGLLRRRSAAITLGCAGLFAALLWTGVAGGGTGATSGAGAGAANWAILAAAGAIVLAWTIGRTSVDLRRELSDTDTRRLEATQVAGRTLLVGGATGIALLPGTTTVRPSPLGLALVLFGAVTLTSALWLE